MELALGVRLEEHESSYLGVYFQAGEPGHCWIKLQLNADQMDEQPVEPEFSDYPVLIYLQAARNQDSVRETLEGIPFVTHLRREYL